MNRLTPFLIKDVNLLRNRIRVIEASESDLHQDAKLWNLLKNSARTAPKQFPWFTPFVALMTKDEQDIANAKSVLQDYTDKLEPMYFTSGLQFHFWCFAFPHAKWCMYFQWLVSLGAFSPEEEKTFRDKLLSFQYLNFFYGMRTKPEPECVDNQTLSLCLSNVMVGYIFSSDDYPSKMAKMMLDEGWRRLPEIVGSMPASGYTGEGSSYIDCVIGPAIPLIVELIEEMTGEKDVLYKSFAPGGVVPEQFLSIVAREWMPGGLLLPWDNYGYQYGVRAPLAYAALKTGEPIYKDILHNHAVWSYDIGVGWAYDDLVWSWIWWPGNEVLDKSTDYSWSERDIGGAIAAQGNDYYLMQMWDESEPVYPARSHVNPNAVLLNAYGIPLSLDGSLGSCTRFHFEDTWREVKYSLGEPTRYNFGDGCAGAHSVLLVDDWEGMRAMSDYRQFRALELDHQHGAIAADVTPIYREHFKDAVQVKRRSSVAADRFFVIEDYAEFQDNHRFTSRFVLRPTIADTGNGVKLVSPEGITLHLIDLAGGTEVKVETIKGAVHYYPMDQEMLLVDFHGTSGKRLFIAFISRVFEPVSSVEGWQTVHDPTEQMTYGDAWEPLLASRDVLPFKLPAYMEMTLPIGRRWWYYKRIGKSTGKSWLQLPRAMHNAKCWMNGREIDLSSISSMLLAPFVPVPSEFEEDTEIDVVIRCDVPVSHFDGLGEGTMGINGGVFVCYPCEEEQIIDASYDGKHIEVKTSKDLYRWPYSLMGEYIDAEPIR